MLNSFVRLIDMSWSALVGVVDRSFHSVERPIHVLSRLSDAAAIAQ